MDVRQVNVNMPHCGLLASTTQRDTPQTRDSAAVAATASTISLLLALACPLLVMVGLHMSVAAALGIGFLGLSGDAYLEMRHALAVSRGQRPKDSRKGLELLLGIIKNAPPSAQLNYFTDLMILGLVVVSLKYGKVPSKQELPLVVILFAMALLSILLIWFLRTLKK